jgi:hypothetical protein
MNAGIPKGQYKGYTCPQCQRAKVSAQHTRQKEKKKKVVDKSSSQTGTNTQAESTSSASVHRKIPILGSQVGEPAHDLFAARSSKHMCKIAIFSPITT